MIKWKRKLHTLIDSLLLTIMLQSKLSRCDDLSCRLAR